MKFKVLFSALLLAVAASGATLQRVPVTTTDFTRSFLTNETAADLRTALGVSTGGTNGGGTPLLSSPTIAVTLISLTSNRLDVVGTLSNNITGNAATASLAANATNISGPATNLVKTLATERATQATNDLPFIAGRTNAVIRQVTGAGGTTNFIDVTAPTSAMKTISLTRPENGDTNWFGPWTPGTTTAGIQEAINSLPVGSTPREISGGRIFIQPGKFMISSTITLPAGIADKPFNLYMQGSGLSATAIINTANDEALLIGNKDSKTPYVFVLEDACIANTQNTCTNVILVEGECTDDGGSTGGGVARGGVYRCFIGLWTSITNNPCFGGKTFTPSSCSDGLKHNLIGLNVHLNFNDPFMVMQNSFNYLGTAISYTADHGGIVDNTFEHCGKAVGNDWPTGSIYYTGATIVFRDVRPTFINGNKDWRIMNNTFVSCPLHYATDMSAAGSFYSVNHILIAGDSDESGSVLAATAGSRLTFVDPKNVASLANYLITNTTDYSTWNTQTSPTNLVGIVDRYKGYQNGPMGVGRTPEYKLDVTNSGYKVFRVATDDDALIQLNPNQPGSNWLFGASTTTTAVKSNVFFWATAATDGTLATLRAYLDPSNPRFVIPSRFATPTNAPTSGQVLTATGTSGDAAWVDPTAGSSSNPTGNGSGLTNINWIQITIGKSNAMFGAWTPGTTTEGWQEALNALPYNQVTNGRATGGKIVVGPGNYYWTNTVTLTNRFLTSVIIEGAGEIASVIHYTGTNMACTATGLTGQPDGARLHFYARDLGFIMDQNVTNAFFDIQEWATVHFRSCFFSYNGYTTNSQWGISPASSLPDPVSYPKKAVGVYLHNSNENNTWFEYCHFNGLAVGMNVAGAHVFIDSCEFVDIGDYTGGTTNGWPITHPNAMGAGVILNGIGYEARMVDCDFISGRTTFALVNTPVGNVNVDGSYFESMGAIYNDDSGGNLKLHNMASDSYSTRQIGSANYTLTSGGISTNTYAEGFANDNIEGGSSPFWSIFGNGKQQMQMMSDFSFRFNSNIIAGPLAQFIGNGRAVTNIATTNLVYHNGVKMVTASGFLQGYNGDTVMDSGGSIYFGGQIFYDRGNNLITYLDGFTTFMDAVGGNSRLYHGDQSLLSDENGNTYGPFIGNGNKITNTPVANLNWGGISTAAFTNIVAGRLAITNGGITYYIIVSTNAP